MRKLYWFLFVYDLNGTPDTQAHYGQSSIKKKLMRDVTCLVLFAYTLLIFSPVMPVIADKMAHTFWEEYHLISVHHVFGGHHVDTEMAKAGKESSKEKPAGNFKFGAEDYQHVIAIITFNFSNNHYIRQSYPSYTFC